MTKQYVKIEVNELRELIESDILLNIFYKRGVDTWSGYDEVIAEKIVFLKYELQERLKKYINCE